MKTQILSKTIFLICLVAVMASCGKKSTTAPDTTMTITMANVPSAPTKNTPVAFTFTVKEGGMLMDVTSNTVEIVKGTDTKTMACMKASTGIYTGTYTFTDSGTYAIHFHYVMSGMDGDMDFNVVVQ